MQIEQTDVPGVLVVVPRRHGDARGFFAETWNGAAWAAAGADLPPFREESLVTLDPGEPLNLDARAGCGRLLRAGSGRARLTLAAAGRAAPVATVVIDAGDGRQVWAPAGIAVLCEAQDGPAEIVCNATDYLGAADGAGAGA